MFRIDFFDSEICSHLCLTNASCLQHGGPSGVEGFANVVDADSGNENGSASRDEHPKSPQGHILLGTQILIGGLVGLIGCYLINYTLGEGRPRDADTGVGYALLGFALVFLGAFLIFSMQFTPFAISLKHKSVPNGENPQECGDCSNYKCKVSVPIAVRHCKKNAAVNFPRERLFFTLASFSSTPISASFSTSSA